MTGRRVIISGGGTGGHLYPALVLGEKLREKDPSLELVFVGSGRESERKIMARTGVRFVAMRIEGLKGRGLRSLRGLLLIPGAFLKSLTLLLRLKPSLVVGVGGYGSGPIVLLAAWMKTPTLIMEQNAKPGVTNRLLVRWVTKAAVAFEQSLPYFKGKGVFLGNPVRAEFTALPVKARERDITLLIFGGSQGSRVLNRAVAAALPHLAPAKDRLAIMHQTGPADLDAVRKAYAENGFARFEAEAFYFDMPSCFRKADLILSRAGATTCAEIIAARKASILIPFAQAADNHQAANAAVLKDAGGAEVILESELTPERLAGRVLDYCGHPERISDMENRLAALRKNTAADDIAGLCFHLMETRA